MGSIRVWALALLAVGFWFAAQIAYDRPAAFARQRAGDRILRHAGRGHTRPNSGPGKARIPQARQKTPPSAGAS